MRIVVCQVVGHGLSGRTAKLSSLLRPQSSCWRSTLSSREATEDKKMYWALIGQSVIKFRHADIDEVTGMARSHGCTVVRTCKRGPPQSLSVYREQLFSKTKPQDARVCAPAGSCKVFLFLRGGILLRLRGFPWKKN